jgi:hypothetical protein
VKITIKLNNELIKVHITSHNNFIIERIENLKIYLTPLFTKLAYLLPFVGRPISQQWLAYFYESIISSNTLKIANQLFYKSHSLNISKGLELSIHYLIGGIFPKLSEF